MNFNGKYRIFLSVHYLESQGNQAYEKDADQTQDITCNYTENQPNVGDIEQQKVVSSLTCL